jgi:hypothetical protein
VGCWAAAGVANTMCHIRPGVVTELLAPCPASGTSSLVYWASSHVYGSSLQVGAATQLWDPHCYGSGPHVLP